MSNDTKIRLTEYSHGAGCGCKISPQVLETILSSELPKILDKNLLVGYDKKDDAAVYAINETQAVISTTDFFMPIVDDPKDFGGIAATNAISDVYAMGGTPIMAIAILGWPIDKIPAEVAQQVLDGGREACHRAGIPLAGGHSIDAPEPIFGLAVTGIVDRAHIKSNDGASEGCHLFLTKPLGVGILSTAQKRGAISEEHLDIAKASMLSLNKIGAELGTIPGIRSMTDVTGFGLLGHLIEMCEGSDVSAEIYFEQVPKIDVLPIYLEKKTIPGGTNRNFASYGHKVNALTDEQKAVLCDPQTSGGLLVAVAPDAIEAFLQVADQHGMSLTSFGRLVEKGEHAVVVK